MCTFNFVLFTTFRTHTHAYLHTHVYHLCIILLYNISIICCIFVFSINLLRVSSSLYTLTTSTVYILQSTCKLYCISLLLFLSTIFPVFFNRMHIYIYKYTTSISCCIFSSRFISSFGYSITVKYKKSYVLLFSHK